MTRAKMILVALITCTGAGNPAVLSAAEPVKVDLVQDLHWKDHHFAMTNWFYKYQFGNPELQIKVLKERGYGGVMLSLKDDPGRWKMLPRYLAALKKHDMRLTAIHARFYIEDGTYPQVIKDNLPLLKDSKVVFIPSVGSRKKMDRKDPKAVAMAVKILREMSDDAKEYGLGGVAPYMHIGNWIETIDDNLRIAKAVDRRNVGVMFHLHHWQAVGNREQDKLAADLKKAKPYLMVVVIQGTDNDKATHKILGEGSFDMTPLVRTLREMDYQGPLGTMGYTQSGDIPGKLERAYQAWEKIKTETAQTQSKRGTSNHKSDDWGPFVGPWERYDKNPIIKLEGKESYSIQNGPQTVIQRDGKWYMFLMTSQPMVTKLAVSEDGLGWKRPHHEYLLKPTMGWEGSYNLAKAAVVHDDEVWLYYFGKKGKTEMIGLARSKDLSEWEKQPQPIFTHKDSRIEGERAFPCCVIKEGGTWYMYYDVGWDYGHRNRPDGYSIGVATSKDGINWTDSERSPLLTTGAKTPDSWDDGMVSQCSVTKNGDWFYMLYSGGTNNHGRKYSGKDRMAFGLARAKHPEGPWEKYPKNPVFKPTRDMSDFDGAFLQHPCPVKVRGQWRLYYNGWRPNPKANNAVRAEYAIGVAFTPAK